MLYDGRHDRERVGYATSLMYCPVLQRHIAMARVDPAYAAKGSTVHLEITVDHEYVTVPRHDRPDAVVQPRPQDGLPESSRGSSDVETTTGGTTVSSNTYDAIVVGGGHNGLVNARVPLQGRAEHAGPRDAVTSSVAPRSPRSSSPGFSFTTFSYALSLLRPDIIHELDLVKHGFMPLLMPVSFSPMENGDYLLLTEDEQFNEQEIGRHSRATSTRYHRWSHDVDRVSSWSSRCSTTRRPTSSATTPRTPPTSPGWSSTCAAPTARSCTT